MNQHKEKIIIHIVDDDHGIRAALNRLLTHAGYDVRLYSSGTDFIEKYDNSPGCVILDLAMPGLSGEQVLHKITAARFSLVVLILTGHATISTAIKLIKAGAIDLIEKPFNNEQLLGKLSKLLDSAQAFFAKNMLIADYQKRLASLTPSERSVLELLLTGMTSREISEHLHNSKKTIDIHRARIMKKMDAASLRDLLEGWIRLGAAAPADHQQNQRPF
ncbi:MAG: response regulator [Gammaproteobacteria bacterium]|nr:response regulator [Gammaproteobacteria bacterium]MBU0885035.1 response regulator [Gammaproteobacteria bacterium]MBU1859077.1 response regulator [Gammaproteobacteria bacterium]